jgi:hypothetical protein
LTVLVGVSWETARPPAAIPLSGREALLSSANWPPSPKVPMNRPSSAANIWMRLFSLSRT